MHYRTMGNSEVPAVGFGTWQLVGELCRHMVGQAIKLGYRHIDTARAYENERAVGDGIKDSSLARDELFLTTKIWRDDLAPTDLRTSLDNSLRDLGTAYADLVLIHWPNPAIPLGETLDALYEAQQAGKLRHYGVSNFPVAHMRAALERHRHPIACNQIEYHPFLDQSPVLAYARQHGIVVTAYSPLARGRVASDPSLQEIAAHYDRTPGQIVMRWLVAHEGVCAIPKTTKVERAQQNLDIFDFSLSEADSDAIARLAGNERLINPSFAPDWDS